MALSAQRGADARSGAFRSRGPWLMTAVATLGVAVHAGVWAVLGVLGVLDQLWGRRQGMGVLGQALLIVLPAAVAAAGQVPVGALTDRYGARLVFPLLSGVTTVCVLSAGYLDGVMGLVAVAAGMAVAGTAFAVGASLVGRRGNEHRRGFAVSVVGAGTGGAAIAAVLVPALPGQPSPRSVTLAVCAVLVGYAVVAVAVIRESPVPVRRTSGPRDTVTVLRLPAVRQWSLMYAAACGPLFAMVLHLPGYLHGFYRQSWDDAAVVTALLVVTAAAAAPVGGWLTQRGSPARLLVSCYASAGVAGVVLAFAPPVDTAIMCLVLVAATLGTVRGAVLCRLGQAVPRERAGLIAGMVGAVGTLGGLVPPALLWATYVLDRQYTIGFMLLSGIAAAAATYPRRRHAWVHPLLEMPHADLVVFEQPEFWSTATTVVALAAGDTAADSAAVLTILAELASRHELIVVYGAAVPPPSGAMTTYALVAAIRDRLPRHKIVAVYVDADNPRSSPEADLIGELLGDGALVIAVVNRADPGPSAVALGERQRADTVRRLTHDHIRGPRLETLPTTDTRRFPARSEERP